MRARCLVAVATALVATHVAVTGATESLAGSCDRQCLTRRVDDYLAALMAHDPARLAVTPSVRFTENAAPLALGDGLWGTFGEIGSYRIDFADPQTGDVALFAIITENSLPSILTLRLKVKG